MEKLKQHLYFLMLLVPFVVIGEANAQDNSLESITPDQVQWNPAPPFLPAGAQFAVIKGDPSQAGPFTIRLKFPAGYEIPGHKHPSFEHITVLSGTLYMNMGSNLDYEKGIVLQEGSFAYGPENRHHAAWATDTETIVQIQSEGPFGIEYSDPANDPRKGY